ncbi:MAG: hypothetical protein HOV87_09420 [Catenulispora sp.]|nr:hypothetical protein [Catenulispora sp.]
MADEDGDAESEGEADDDEDDPTAVEDEAEDADDDADDDADEVEPWTLEPAAATGVVEPPAGVFEPDDEQALKDNASTATALSVATDIFDRWNIGPPFGDRWRKAGKVCQTAPPPTSFPDKSVHANAAPRGPAPAVSTSEIKALSQ